MTKKLDINDAPLLINKACLDVDLSMATGWSTFPNMVHHSNGLYKTNIDSKELMGAHSKIALVGLAKEVGAAATVA